MRSDHRNMTSTGKGFGNAWDAGLPTRVPNTKSNWRDVACPSCEAPIKKRCINLGLRTGPQDKGKPLVHAHPSRKRLAQKRWNEAHL